MLRLNISHHFGDFSFNVFAKIGIKFNCIVANLSGDTIMNINK